MFESYKNLFKWQEKKSETMPHSNAWRYSVYFTVLYSFTLIILYNWKLILIIKNTVSCNEALTLSFSKKFIFKITV